MTIIEEIMHMCARTNYSISIYEFDILWVVVSLTWVLMWEYKNVEDAITRLIPYNQNIYTFICKLLSTMSKIR